jgi:hypothetical protein
LALIPHFLDGSDEKSLATAAAASFLLDESGSLLLPPANNLTAANKINHGLDIKRTTTHPLGKVYIPLSFLKQVY